MFLLSVFTNILIYSSIMYILSCVLFIFRTISLAHLIFHLLLIFQYTTQCVVMINYVYCLLWFLTFPELLCCFFLLVLLRFLGRLLFYHSQTPLQNQRDWIGKRFEIPFPADQFESSK